MKLTYLFINVTFVSGYNSSSAEVNTEWLYTYIPSWRGKKNRSFIFFCPMIINGRGNTLVFY